MFKIFIHIAIVILIIPFLIMIIGDTRIAKFKAGVNQKTQQLRELPKTLYKSVVTKIRPRSGQPNRQRQFYFDPNERPMDSS